MKKVVSPGLPARGTRSVLQGTIACTIISTDSNIKNLPSKDLKSVIICARGFLAAGQQVDENLLFDKCPSRYRRGNCLKALRVLHRLYPNTRLVLESGIYVLYPSGGERA